MNTQFRINEDLYNYLYRHNEINLTLDEHNIELNDVTKTIKFICNKTTTTVTLFAVSNSMRYIPYTVDALMADIIGTFGYEGELHQCLDEIIHLFKPLAA